MSAITDELEKMTELITSNTVAPGTEVSGTNAPATNAPATELPNTESPGTEAPGTNAPATEASATDAPTTEVPVDEIGELRKTIEELNKKVGELSTTKSPKTSAPTTDVPISEEDFLGDIDFDDLLRDKDKFNKILNAVHKKGVEVGRVEGRAGQEKVLRNLPTIVKTNIEITAKLKEASDKFYGDNKDLEPFKKVVGQVFEEEAAKDPSRTYGEILKNVGPEVRKRLELQEKTVKKVETKGPKLPKRSAQNRQNQKPPATEPLLQEIDGMNEALENQ